MNASERLRLTPIPDRLAVLPRDDRGYPIFWSITQDDGTYDFRHIPVEKIIRSGVNRLCGLCGQVMRGPVVFIGGPLSCKNRVFSDPPMHDECAVYAWNVCPYITRLGWEREKTAQAHEINPDGILDKPLNMALYACRNYIMIPNNAGYPLFRAYPAIRIEWKDEHGPTDHA